MNDEANQDRDHDQGQGQVRGSDQSTDSDQDRGFAPVNSVRPSRTGRLWLAGIEMTTTLIIVYAFPGGQSVDDADVDSASKPRVSQDSDFKDPLGADLGAPARPVIKPTLPVFTPPVMPRIEPRIEPRYDPRLPVQPVGTAANPGQRPVTPAERRMQGGLSGARVRTVRSTGRGAPQPAMPASMTNMLAHLGANKRMAPPHLQGAAVPKPANDGDSGALATQLKPTRLAGATARRLNETTLLLARGRLFECVLDTAISSVIAGQARCTVPIDVYGEDGKVVLLDRGTEVIGEYRSGLSDAQTRLGILWTRAKTPAGVIVELASPASDNLGRAGVTGQVQTYFWKRFGAAVMLSILDDALAAASANSRRRHQSGAGNGGNLTLNNTTRAARDLASMALERTINIAPVLVKNQGESVSIFLARDLSFREVYAHRQLGVR